MRGPDFSELLVVKVIEGALELLSQPGAWTKRSQARSANGTATKPEADDARCWCTKGALRRAAFMAIRPADERSRQRTLLLVEAAASWLSVTLAKELRVERTSSDPARHLLEWNDYGARSQEEVVELFRRTLRRLGAGEKRARAA